MGSAAGSGEKRALRLAISGSRPALSSAARIAASFPLASAIVGERQQIDHQATGFTFGELLDQAIEGVSIGVPGEQLVAVDQAQQGHGLAAQGVDDVPVVDDVAVLARRRGTSTSKGDEGRRADEEVEPVVIQPHTHPVADQARGHGVEHLLEDEAAGRGDGDQRLLVVARPAIGQRPQRRARSASIALPRPGVVAADDLVDEAPIGGQVVEPARAAHEQGVEDRLLQVAVGTLDGAVLVGDAAVVAGRLHAVVGHQRLVAPGQVVPGGSVEVAERRRQAVAAMLAGRAA